MHEGKHFSWSAGHVVRGAGGRGGADGARVGYNWDTQGYAGVTRPGSYGTRTGTRRIQCWGQGGVVPGCSMQVGCNVGNKGHQGVHVGCAGIRRGTQGLQGQVLVALRGTSGVQDAEGPLGRYKCDTLGCKRCAHTRRRFYAGGGVGEDSITRGSARSCTSFRA